MAPRQLTEADKRAMQSARVRTRKERAAAREALEGNPQFLNPKFWASVDPAVLADIEKAMEKAKSAIKRRKIATLEAQIAALKGE